MTFVGSTRNRQRAIGLLFDKCRWKYRKWDRDAALVVLTTDSDSLFKAAEAVWKVNVTKALLAKIKESPLEVAADFLTSKMLLKR